MNRSRLTFLALSLLVMLPLVSGALLARGEDDGDDSLYKYLSVFQDVLRLVRQAYVEDVGIEQLMEGALDGTSDALDPFSTYVPASEVEAYRRVLDIGAAHSGLVIAKDRGILYALSVAAGSPAAEAGLERGDILTAIDAEPTRPMPLWRAQRILAGEPGTVVGLDLLRGGAATEATLTLAPYEPELVRFGERDGVPVLEVVSLGPETVAAVHSVLTELPEGASRLLVDLRETLDRDVESAYAVGEFFASGELGRLTSSEGTEATFASAGEPLFEGDLVVLIGNGTLGGAEVLASILRGSAGATLVGEPSFGHAARLRLVPLSSGAHLRLSDAFYSGPESTPIVEGLEPDVEVSERTRTFATKDVPLDDLILRRGIEILERGAVEEAAEAA